MNKVQSIMPKGRYTYSEIQSQPEAWEASLTALAESIQSEERRLMSCWNISQSGPFPFPAEIMGGHVIYQARIGHERVLSQGDQMDVLVAMGSRFARLPS